MPIEYLAADHLALLELTNRVPPDYVAFMQRMMPGDAGRAIVANEGCTRQQVKNRLDAVAGVLGITLRYLPRSKDEVVFEAVYVSSETIGQRRRRRDVVVADVDDDATSASEVTTRPVADPVSVRTDPHYEL